MDNLSPHLYSDSDRMQRIKLDTHGIMKGRVVVGAQRLLSRSPQQLSLAPAVVKIAIASEADPTVAISVSQPP